MNILILSVGTRNKIVQYFKEELKENGNVITADMSLLAPALYCGDKYYQVPRITDERYIDTILDICIKENVTGVLSLIDPELSLLALNCERFETIGTKIIGSSFDVCETAFDKIRMYEWLECHGYKSAKSYTSMELFFDDIEAGAINYPVFIKPICGSASLNINKAYDKETVELLFSKSDNLMIQEFLDGQEIGADVYIDMISKEVISIFTKKKLLMRAGETDKAVSFKDEVLFRLISKFVKEFGFIGQIDIDIFDVNGEYYISEVNPRFGGGYPLAYECGCNHMQLIYKNLLGNENVPNIGRYEENIYMMKYNETAIIRK